MNMFLTRLKPGFVFIRSLLLLLLLASAQHTHTQVALFISIPSKTQQTHLIPLTSRLLLPIFPAGVQSSVLNVLQAATCHESSHQS